MNNYNLIAPIYDKLGKLVFGNLLHHSAIHYLYLIKPNDRILICGGGTGKILTALDSLEIDLAIHFVEMSPKMMQKAKNKAPFNNIKVYFEMEDIFKSALTHYDVVITPFFLDMFDEKSLLKLIVLIKSKLANEGQWLHTDFIYPNEKWRRALIACMYLFFRLTTNIGIDQLLPFEKYFNKLGLVKKRNRLFYDNMIEAGVFEKV